MFSAATLVGWIGGDSVYSVSSFSVLILFTDTSAHIRFYFLVFFLFFPRSLWFRAVD